MATTITLRQITATPSTVITGTAIDVQGLQKLFFRKAITSADSFTFSNFVDGAEIALLLSNTSGGDLTVSFPAGIKRGGGTPVGLVKNNMANVYTFINMNGTIYCSVVKDMA